MSGKHVLSIQDISCFGQCSLTVALPIISACGIETSILPSAVLSTHTGGAFKGWTFRDLADDIPAIEAHWNRQGILFDAIYTGYLGSAKQIDYVKHIFTTCAKPGCVKIVDPAMGDNGLLYAGFDQSFADTMKNLCAAADYVLPNITECCYLTGSEYKEDYDPDYIEDLLRKMAALGPKFIILTGVSYNKNPASTGVVIYDGTEMTYYEHRKLPKGSHGTGDVYASAFVGALMNGFSAFQSARIAADFTVRCIENTQDDPDHWYGVKFEPVLPELLKALGKVSA